MGPTLFLEPLQQYKAAGCPFYDIRVIPAMGTGEENQNPPTCPFEWAVDEYEDYWESENRTDSLQEGNSF